MGSFATPSPLRGAFCAWLALRMFAPAGAVLALHCVRRSLRGITLRAAFLGPARPQPPAKEPSARLLGTCAPGARNFPDGSWQAATHRPGSGDGLVAVLQLAEPPDPHSRVRLTPWVTPAAGGRRSVEQKIG